MKRICVGVSLQVEVVVVVGAKSHILVRVQ